MSCIQNVLLPKCPLPKCPLPKRHGSVFSSTSDSRYVEYHIARARVPRIRSAGGDIHAHFQPRPRHIGHVLPSQAERKPRTPYGITWVWLSFEHKGMSYAETSVTGTSPWSSVRPAGFRTENTIHHMDRVNFGYGYHSNTIQKIQCDITRIRSIL